MQKRILSVWLMVVSSLMIGCGGSEKKIEPPKPELSKTDQMRQKAKLAEAASLVGYDGKAIKDNLNKIIDESERSEKQLKDLNDLR